MQGLKPGDRLNEAQLSRHFRVSRTPVRAVLDHLVAEGHARREPNLGTRLVSLPATKTLPPQPDDQDDDLLMRIAADRRAGTLPREFSETEIMRIYDLNRRAARDALERLAEVDVVDRKPGYGWYFLDEVPDRRMRTESYRFRMIVEVAAILEPGFTLDPEWAGATRKRHDATLSASWTSFSSVDFFEMNASFHEGICAASGNRFLLDGIRRQNRLRRLANYDWKYGEERVRTNTREHLGILDRLEAGDMEVAAILMRRHLAGAEKVLSPGRHAGQF